MKKIWILLIILFVANTVSAYELNTLIDCPTAGILQRGESEITAKLYKDNGLLLGTKIGLFPRFMFGVNYGAEEIVGNKEPNWHERVEFNAKFRIVDETAQMPAIAIGYDSQGHGKYNTVIDSLTEKEITRYDIKSKGFYLVGSKNYLFLGNLGFHFGANYSLEIEDGDKELDFFAGLDKTIGDIIILTCEYDLAWNDNENWTKNTIEENIEILHRGYLNAAMSVNFADFLSLKVSFYDLMQKRSDTNLGDRTLTILYNMTF